ncbi:MAG: L-rhamnose mutarotase [Rikenellaceae bacterium]
MEQRYIVEIIGQEIDTERVEALAKSSGAECSTLYRWRDHVALYSSFADVDNFVEELKKACTSIEVKLYERPFYQFKLTEHCKSCPTAKEWKHNILTANLVDDKVMQQEYMDYHYTQFEKWPEVARGFCNAGFQEVNLYRNGRQLMLVISIPADKNLSEIDPKTVENNPRVDDWNAIMGKYQEGVKGSAPDEKWVFLNEIK